MKPTIHELEAILADPEAPPIRINPDGSVAAEEKYAKTELIYWLLRAYQSGHREGWEDTPSVQETMDGLLDVLANYGYDPSSPQAAALLKIGPFEA